MAKKVAKKVTKKRVKKNVERGQAHIQSSFNNTIVRCICKRTRIRKRSSNPCTSGMRNRCSKYQRRNSGTAQRMPSTEA